jgi:hypothetical protein
MAPYVLCIYLHATCIATVYIATTQHTVQYIVFLTSHLPVCLLPHYYGRVRPCVCNPRAQQGTEVCG